MLKSPLFKSAAELLAAILSGTSPADAQMERHFRAHPKLGARDRGYIAETVYACLRRRRFLDYLASGGATTSAAAEAIVAACLVALQNESGRALADAGFRGDGASIVERVRTLDMEQLPLGVQLDLPDWLLERLLAQYGEGETRALAAALNQPATLDLRVNTLKATREEAAACLAEAGLPVELAPYSPFGLRRHERAPVFRTRCFEEGLIEVQDEGSQLLSLLLEPKRREMVVDFCAGAGGKTLHLAALMANSGSVYAFDVSAKRLERLKPRLARAGLNNVRSVAIQNERDVRVQRLAGKIDRVLVDAPCSGTGTLRRNPDIKWRAIDMEKLVATQRAILASASTLLKPGGRLVYATCSLLREENDAVVADFLATHPDFAPLPAAEILARRQIVLPAVPSPIHTLAMGEGGVGEIEAEPSPHPSAIAPGIALPPASMQSSPASGRGGVGENLLYGLALRLLPHIHHTDAFYAIVLVRRA
jgi:16S rRNA (cytosine967-C5)-methyltransferase